MIRVENLTKTYKISRPGHGLIGLIKPDITYVEAVKGVSFSVDRGELIGLLGANGAGKTTIIKMLTGVLTPTNGEIRINDYVPKERKKAFLSSIGLMMGNRSSLIYDLPIKDSFQYLQTIYSVKKNEYTNQIDNLVEKLNLTSLLNTPVRKLSLGQRKKAELIASVIHQPKVLFLDEPTIGLDVKSKKEMLSFVKYLSEDLRTTVILTSHDLNDIERICKRIIYVDEGKIVYDGSTANFGTYKNKRKVQVIFEQVPNDQASFMKYQHEAADEYNYTFFVDHDEINDFINLIGDSGIDEFTIQKVTLEDRVLEYVGTH